jgi:hypothetical protein
MIYRAKTPKHKEEKSSYFSELGVLCVFARGVFFQCGNSHVWLIAGLYIFAHFFQSLGRLIEQGGEVFGYLFMTN